MSATIGQLAWPAFLLIVILLLKEQIKQIAASPRLRKLKAGPGGVEIELDSQVEKQLEDAKRELDEPGASKALPSGEATLADTWEGYNGGDFYQEMRKLAELSPRSVVLETHARLEKLLRDAAKLSPEFPFVHPRRSTVRNLARLAADSDLLSRQEVSVIDELSTLRNRVAHEPDHAISVDTAMEYVEVATRVALSLRLSVGGELLNGPPL